MKKVMVIYHSQQYGNTETCAELVAQGLQESDNIEVEMLNTNEVQRVDMAELTACDGVAIGSPDYASYVAGTIKQLFDDIYAHDKGVSTQGKPCVLFMTHGGGGDGMEALESLAHRFDLLADPFLCRGAPPEACREAIDLGRALAKTATE